MTTRAKRTAQAISPLSQLLRDYRSACICYPEKADALTDLYVERISTMWKDWIIQALRAGLQEENGTDSIDHSEAKDVGSLQQIEVVADFTDMVITDTLTDLQLDERAAAIREQHALSDEQLQDLVFSRLLTLARFCQCRPLDVGN